MFFSLYFKVYPQIRLTDFRNCRCIFNVGILLLISGVKEWIRTCLPRNPDNERSLLVWDSFRAHLTESVKADLQRRNFNVAVIPKERKHRRETWSSAGLSSHGQKFQQRW